MQPSYDTWDSEPHWQADGGCGKGGFEEPNAYGLVDISKGKGKGGSGKGSYDSWDNWGDSSGNAPPLPGSAEVPRPPPAGNYGGKGGGGFGRSGIVMASQLREMADNNSLGKSGLMGKAPAPSSANAFVPDVSSKGKPGFSYKGKLAPRKADFNGKADFPVPKPTSAYPPLPSPVWGDKGLSGTTPPSSVPVPPPSFMASKAASQVQRGPAPTLAPVPPPQFDGSPRGPARQGTVVAPRLPILRPDVPKGVGVPPRLPLAGTTVRPPGYTGPGTVRPPLAATGPGTVRPPPFTSPGFNATGFGTSMGPAVIPRVGPGAVMRPPQLQSRYVPPSPRPPSFGAMVPHGGVVQPQAFGSGIGAGLGKPVPALSNAPQTVLPQTSPSSLAPELAALVSAEGDNDSSIMRLGPLIPEKKPRIYLLVTKLAPELDEGHMQQIIEQCGEVQAFRRGRDADGKPLSFGFAQFGDPEAAWKASTCLSKRVLCGQEIKVLVEERAESLIQQWRRSQQAALRVSTDEELDWELERKAVSCKASIDAKVEEIFGPPEDGASGGAVVQRRQELREREKQRITRLKKRKAWRMEEFSREVERIEAVEKRLRKEEVQKDDNDRGQEEAELKEKKQSEDDENLKISRPEDMATPGSRLKAADKADNRKLVDMVDIVQSEPRDDLFRMELNTAYLRNEKILETKLRPWLERKVDLCMGGPQSDLVEYILRRVNASSLPDSLISELTRYLDDNAEPMVERMWRMLAFELMRGGYAFTDSLEKRKGGQQPPQQQGQ